MTADIIDFHEAAQALEMYWSLRDKRAISKSEYDDLKNLMFAKLRSSSNNKQSKEID